MAPRGHPPELLVPDAAAWREWLAEHHTEPDGVFLVLSRKGGDVTALTYPLALDEALCQGWIDGQVRSRDAGSFAQRFTPRRARSPWSLRNVDHVARLTAEGRMQPAGLAAVAAAQADGRWDRAYAGQATAELPADLVAAVDADPAARATLDRLTAQNRYALYFRLSQLTDPARRAARIEAFVAMLARGETPHPQRGPG
ncbi:YdeI/OmpD-associated family protein [Rhodococcus aerolatus]